MIEVVQAGLGVPHGFLGRTGGISTGPASGLNCGTGSNDDPLNVTENRRRAVAAVLPGGKLCSVYQVHSGDAVIAEPWPIDERPHADALVSDRPGLVLGILTADCAPVLFADAEGGVVGAAHAGWKGALAGVTDATIALMETLGAKRERIAAAIGPCIAQASYEVRADFAKAFAPGDKGFFAKGRRGHRQFDLEGYVAHRLAAAGIARVKTLGIDTYDDELRYFSYRRATHRGEDDYGRQLSLIGLADL